MFVCFFLKKKVGEKKIVYIYISCNLAPLGHGFSSFTPTGNDRQVLHCEGTHKGYMTTSGDSS